MKTHSWCRPWAEWSPCRGAASCAAAARRDRRGCPVGCRPRPQSPTALHRPLCAYPTFKHPFKWQNLSEISFSCISMYYTHIVLASKTRTWTEIDSKCHASKCICVRSSEHGVPLIPNARVYPTLSTCIIVYSVFNLTNIQGSTEHKKNYIKLTYKMQTLIISFIPLKILTIN